MARTVHSCTECGHETAGWLGRCPGCGEWNTLVEQRVEPAAAGAGGVSRRTARAAKAVPLAEVQATLEAETPEVCVVDSVRTLHAGELTGAAGSVGQVREVAGRLARIAKRRGVAIVLVGHVTKDGALAGPRVLEHLVDCVLQF